ncbi:hypothetical protein IAU60_001128 [Kwoniella sp. DSM 27419]
MKGYKTKTIRHKILVPKRSCLDMFNSYWSPYSNMYGYGSPMTSPYYSGGLGIPYMMGMGGMGYGAGMYGMGMAYGGMGYGYPYGMMMQNPYGYTGLYGYGY